MKRHIRNSLRRFGVFLLMTSAVAMFAIMVLVIRLLGGPVDVPVRTALLDRAISGIAPGWQVAASGAQLQLLARDGLSGLVLSDVVLSDPTGNRALTLPRLAMRFALRPSSALESALTVREVSIADADVTVTRNASGGFHLGVSNAIELDSDAPGDAGLDDLLAGAALDRLPRLRVANARVSYHDIATGTRLAAREGSFRLDPGSESLRIGIDGTFARAGGGETVVSVGAERDTASGRIEVQSTFEGLVLADVAPLDATLANLGDVRVALNGSARVTLGPEGDVEQIAAQIEGMPGGTLLLADRERQVERLKAEIAFDAMTGTLELNGADLTATGLETKLSAAFRRIAPQRWEGMVSAPRLALRDPVEQRMLSLDAVKITGAVDLAARVLRLDSGFAEHLAAAGAGGSVSLGALETAGEIGLDTRIMTLANLSGTALRLDLDTGETVAASAISGALRLEAANDSVTIREMQLADVTTAGLGADLSATGIGLDGKVAAGLLTLTRLDLSDVRAKTGARSLEIGAARAQGRADPGRGQFDLSALEMRAVRLGLPDRYDRPLAIDTLVAALSGRREPEGLRLRLGDVRTRIDGLQAELKGELLLREEGGIAGSLDTALGPTVFREVPRFWPKRVAPGALRWVSKNVHGGTVSRLAIAARFDSARPESDEMRLAFDFADAEIGIAGELPPIRAANGRGIATLHRFDLELESGRVEPPGTAPFHLAASRFSIGDFKPRVPKADILLKARGPVQSVLRYLDHQPLGFISEAGFDISSASADAEAEVKIRLPLARDMKVEDVEFSADGTLRDFSFLEPNTGLPIAGDLMRIKVSPKGLRFDSDARADGLSARLSYTQGFAKPENGAASSVVELESFLTPEDFARRGFDVGDYLDGVTVVDARVELFPGGGARFRANADLTGTAVHVDRIGWRKPHNSPATVMLSGFRNPAGEGRVEQIEIRGERISGDATLVYDAAGSVTSADFERLVLADRLDSAIRYRKGAEGGARIELEGRAADLRKPFAEAVDAGAEQRAAPRTDRGPATEIAVKLETARLRDDLVVNALEGGVRLRGGRTDAARIGGRLNGVAPFSLLAERRDQGLALQLGSENAGAFLGATKVFAGASGGRLRLDAVTRDTVLPAEIRGRVRIDEIAVRQSETLGEIFASGAIGSLMRQMTSGDGLRLQKVELPFSGVGGRWQIREGLAYGPAIGVTLRGNYDIARKGIDLNGTVSPAYAINGALGAVPLLGQLLTGGEGEGVFGVTFAARGTTEAPEVWVNPLSALAPGFLRKIVSGVMDGTPEGHAKAPSEPRVFRQPE